MIAERGTTRCPLATLQPATPLLGVSATSDELYLIFPKKIQVFGPAPDHSLISEILLNDSIRCHSLFGNVMLLLYDSKVLERRLLSDWENPLILGQEV